MKSGKLIAFIGAAIVASSPALLTGASAASAAAVPAAASSATTISVGNCTLNVTPYNGRNSNGAYEIVTVNIDSCSIGVEAGIEGPDGTPSSWGGDVHNAGDQSRTGYIPINSGNHHGLRYWYDNVWNYYWFD